MATANVTRRKSAKRASTKGKTVRTADDRFADQMYRTMMRKPAMLAKEEIDRFERTASLRDWVRRAMWHFLAMSGKETIQKCRENRDFAFALAMMDRHSIPDYVASLEGVIGFMKTLQARSMIALACREDMDEIFAEAKRACDEGEAITADNVDQMLRDIKGPKPTH